MKRSTRVALSVVVVLVMGLVPGCAKRQTPTPTPTPVTPTPTESVTPTKSVTSKEPVTPTEPVLPILKTTQVRLYFIRGEYLGVAGRKVQVGVPAGGASPTVQSRAKAAMTALLAGPTAQDKGFGLGTTIPAGTKLNGVKLSGHTATVDMSSKFESGGGSLSMLLRVSQVVYTLTQFEGIDRVAFKLDGKSVSSIGGEGIIVSPPVTRADFEGQAPPILVESPVPGQSVKSPIIVSGSANVFEAQFNLEVKDPTGAVVTSRSIKATSGTGTRGTFKAKVVFESSKTGTGTFVFFDLSEKDGSRIDVIKIPVEMTK